MNAQRAKVVLSRKRVERCIGIGVTVVAWLLPAITLLLLVTMVVYEPMDVGIIGVIAFTGTALVFLKIVIQQGVLPLFRRRLCRPRFQFSLKTLLIVCALIGIELACVTQWIQEIRTKRRSLDNLWAVRVGVSFDEPLPEWVYNTFGTDAYLTLREIDSVSFQRTTLTDSAFSDLKILSPRDLYFGFCNVADGDLDRLHELPQLVALCLHRTTVTDEGLRHVATLSGLRRLRVSYASVTDDGVAHLKDLPVLSLLDLQGNAVTDGAVKHLKGITSLKTLDLSQTKITDAAVADLKEMSGLESLSLIGTPISNSAIEELCAALPNTRIFDPQGWLHEPVGNVRNRR